MRLRRRGGIYVICTRRLHVFGVTTGFVFQASLEESLAFPLIKKYSDSSSAVRARVAWCASGALGVLNYWCGWCAGVPVVFGVLGVLGVPGVPGWCAWCAS